MTDSQRKNRVKKTQNICIKPTLLMKSVMEAIPSYVMQEVALSMHVCEKIDKISRDFTWGSIENKRKLHLIGWGKLLNRKRKEV